MENPVVLTDLNAVDKFIIPLTFSAPLIILGKDFIYNDVKTWIFTGDSKYESRGADQLRKEFEDKYFSECPKNLKKPKIGTLKGKS